MLKHRLITGILTGAFIVVAILYAPCNWLLGLLIAIFALALTEYKEMLNSRNFRIELLTMFVCGAAYLVALTLETPAYRALYPKCLAPQLPPLSEVLLWVSPAIMLIVAILRRKTDNALTCFAQSVAGFWYTAVLLGFFAMIPFAWPAARHGTGYCGAIPAGRIILIYFLLLVKMGDVGAYAFGMALGRNGRRLIPEISPAKSVAGLGGAYVGSMAVSLIAWGIAAKFGGGCIGELRLTLPHAVLLALLMATTGVFGDLAESLFKRSLAVKDSSNRFPGLGGALDMLDSPLFAAPFFYIYVEWFMR